MFIGSSINVQRLRKRYLLTSSGLSSPLTEESEHQLLNSLLKGYRSIHISSSKTCSDIAHFFKDSLSLTNECWTQCLEFLLCGNLKMCAMLLILWDQIIILRTSSYSGVYWHDIWQMQHWFFCPIRDNNWGEIGSELTVRTFLGLIVNVPAFLIRELRLLPYGWFIELST